MRKFPPFAVELYAKQVMNSAHPWEPYMPNEYREKHGWEAFKWWLTKVRYFVWFPLLKKHQRELRPLWFYEKDGNILLVEPREFTKWLFNKYIYGVPGKL